MFFYWKQDSGWGGEGREGDACVCCSPCINPRSEGSDKKINCHVCCKNGVFSFVFIIVRVRDWLLRCHGLFWFVLRQ
jgi:hypothetical protein